MNHVHHSRWFASETPRDLYLQPGRSSLVSRPAGPLYLPWEGLVRVRLHFRDSVTSPGLFQFMCLTDLLRMVFQSALTLRLLVCFPIDHCQRAYNDLVTTTVFLLPSTRCSSVDCVGIPLRVSLNLANSWYQALDAYTFWDYNESIPFCGSYWIQHEVLETILTVWSHPPGFLDYHYFYMIVFP